MMADKVNFDRQFRTFAWDAEGSFADDELRMKAILPQLTQHIAKTFADSKPADAAFIFDAYRFATIDDDVLVGRGSRFHDMSIIAAEAQMLEEVKKAAKILNFDHALVIDTREESFSEKVDVRHREYMVALTKVVRPHISQLATRKAVTVEVPFKDTAEPTIITGIKLSEYSNDERAKDIESLTRELPESALVIGNFNSLKPDSYAAKILRSSGVVGTTLAHTIGGSVRRAVELKGMARGGTTDTLEKIGMESAFLGTPKTKDISWLPQTQLDHAYYTPGTLQVTDTAIVDISASDHKGIIAEVAPVAYKDNYLGTFYPPIKES